MKNRRIPVVTTATTLLLITATASPTHAFSLRAIARFFGLQPETRNEVVVASQATSDTPRNTVTLPNREDLPKRWAGKTYTLHQPEADTKNGKVLPLSAPYAVFWGVNPNAHEVSTFLLANEGVKVRAIQGGEVESVSHYVYENEGKGAPPEVIFNAGHGKYVIVRTNNTRIMYANLKDVVVKAGQQITPGMQLGTVGSSGEGRIPGLKLIARQEQDGKPQYLDLEPSLFEPDTRTPDYDENIKGVDLTPSTEEDMTNPDGSAG